MLHWLHGRLFSAFVGTQYMMSAKWINIDNFAALELFLFCGGGNTRNTRRVCRKIVQSQCEIDEFDEIFAISRYRDEWRYWQKSPIAIVAAAIAATHNFSLCFS